jgi:hypothetical protein
MPMTPDEALNELLDIVGRLDVMAPDDPQRARLESRREELRIAAREAALSSRNPANARAELAHLRRRLAALEAEAVKTPSWQRHLPARINDPDAPARLINRRIDELNEPERQDLVTRIRRLEAQLEEPQ